MNHHIARWSVILAIAIAFVVTVGAVSARAPELTFTMADVSVREPDTGSIATVLTASLVLGIVHPDVPMKYSTTAGTATEGTACTLGVDYIGAHNEQLTLSSRQNSVHITVHVCGDIRYEPNETFTVALLDGNGLTVQAKSKVTIVDNDPAPLPWSGLTAEGTIAKTEEQRWQTPDLPAGNYVFTLGNLSGDADLYVRIGAAPTVTTYSCRPAKASADEICSLSLSLPDVIYVMVRGYATSSRFKLTGSAK